jgi:cystathionine beta-synthase
MFVGYTSGAVVQAVKQLQDTNEFKPSDVIVLIFPDHGSRYMSKIYNDQWMQDQGFFDAQNQSAAKDIEFIK